MLARPAFETIRTRTVMSVPPDLTKTTSLSEEEIERIDKVLAVKADTSARRLEILKRFLPIAQDDSNPSCTLARVLLTPNAWPSSYDGRAFQRQ